MSEGHLPERLFRDDGGAALERAARLEDENRRLRAELDRLRQGSESRPPSFTESPPPFDPTLAGRSARAVVAFGLGAALLATTLAGFGARRHHVRHHSRPTMIVPMSTATAPTTSAQPVFDDPSIASPQVVPLDDCYSYDARGMRHYKRDCIVKSTRHAR